MDPAIQDGGSRQHCFFFGENHLFSQLVSVDSQYNSVKALVIIPMVVWYTTNRNMLSFWSHFIIQDGGRRPYIFFQYLLIPL